MDVKPLIGLAGVILLAVSTEFNDQVTLLALADVRGGLGIGLDQGTWVSSIYVAAESLGMAVSPWLMVTFTPRRFTVFTALLCCFSSVLIPASPNVETVYLLRALQGLSNGFAIPTLLAIALRVLTPDIRLYGLGIYALTATFTTGTAAALAALWTELVGWQFVFLQALPFCTLAAILMWTFLPQDAPQYHRFRLFDWRGFVLIAIGFPALITTLMHGDRLDWFNSPFICVLTLVSGVAIPLLLVNEWSHPLPFFKLQLFGRRNFAYAGIAFITFLVIAQSGSSLPIQFLQNVQGFRPAQTYQISAVLALLQFVMLPALAFLLDFRAVDARVVSFIGLVLIIVACIGASLATLSFQVSQFILWQILQGIGQPMVVMPLLLLSTNTIKGPDEAPFASAEINTPRAVAEAIGPWLIALIMRWRGGLHSARAIDQFGLDRFRLGTPGGAGALAPQLEQQVTILTLSDAYLIFAALAGVLIVVLLVLPVRTLPPRLQLAQQQQH